MRPTLFTALLALALYLIFVVGNTWLGYWILGAAGLVWLYTMFRAALGNDS